MNAPARPSWALRSELAWGACGFLAFGFTMLEVGFPRGLPGACLAAISVFIARADWRERIIPNAASLAAAILALVEAGLSDQPQGAVIDALIRGTTVFALFLAFRFAFRLWRGREGLGFGDVKLAGVIGLWLDWPYIPVAIEIACLSAIGYVVASKIITRQAVDALTKLPFGSFLAPALWATWFWQKMAF